MTRSLTSALLAGALLGLAATATDNASAQSVWMPELTGKGITLEVLKPLFKGTDNISFLTSSAFLSFQTPLSSKVCLVADLPFSYAGIRTVHSSVIGNPYLGIRLGSASRRVSTQLGFRLPVAKVFGSDDFSVGFGFVANPERWEAFLPDVASFNWTVGFNHRRPSGLTVRLRGGPSVLYSRDTKETISTVAYSGLIGYDNARIGAGIGFLGQRNSQGGSSSQFGFMVTVPRRRFQPGVVIKFPVGDNFFSAFVRAIVGVNLSVKLDQGN